MKFSLDGINVNIEIEGYRKSSVSNWSEEWCQVRLRIDSSFINYEVQGPFLLCNEIETIFEKLCALVANKLPRREHMFFADPVMELRLRPALDTEDGDGQVDMYLIINFEDETGVVTANNLQILMGAEDVEKFRKYIKSVIVEGLIEAKVNMDFEYYIGYGDGNYSRVHEWTEEILETDAKLIEEGLANGLHLDEMEGLEELRERLYRRISAVEGDNLRDAGIWSEDSFNEYGTDDPFKVFELIIDVKDR